LQITLFATVAVAVAVGVLLVGLNWRIRGLQDQGAGAQAVVEAVFRLRTLTLEYVLSPHERVLVQWRSIHGEALEALRRIRVKTREDQGTIAELYQDHEMVTALMRQLTSLAQTPDGAQQGRIIVAGQLLLKTEAMTFSALQLVRGCQQRIFVTQYAAGITVVLLIAGLVAMVGITNLRLIRSVLIPLKRLAEGAERIGGGDLDHRIGLETRDEMGELGAAFDQMTENLLQSRSRQGRAEQALRESELRLRLITENIEDAFWLGTPGAEKIIYISPGYERLWGRSCKSLYEDPRSFVDGIHPDDREKVVEALPRQAEGVVNYEYRVIQPGGALRWIRARTFPAAHDEVGNVLLVAGIATDISDVKNAEELLRHSNAELANTLAALRAAQEQIIQTEKVVALGTMAAGIAHELNNPLMGIMAFVTYARAHPATPRSDELLDRAGNELTRMRDLIRGMLSFAHPMEGRLSTVSLVPLIDDALELVRADLKTRGISVDLQLEQDLPLVQAKPPQLEQAFLNILLNARDALHDAPYKRITLRAWSDGEHVIVEIADSGPGVPEAIRHRIFDPFFTTRPPGEGTGLGLSVSRSIVEDLGGELTLESREGEGARFRLRLRKSTDAAKG
jgi:PAS domain S-box-containing protein